MSFYRWHLSDPVVFEQSLRVTVQQLGMDLEGGGLFERSDDWCATAFTYCGDDDGTILKIADLEPHDLEAESSEHPVRFVLEVNQGWFDERGIAPGTRLAGPVFLE